jgi:hypothetical protein
MSLLIYVAAFFGGAFFANALPHLLAGISGRPLQTPFASPPFKGLSPPTVNVAWALTNLAASYALLISTDALDTQRWQSVATCFVGFSAMSFQCARSFARLHKD